MDDILASIRKIISDDDAPAPETVHAAVHEATTVAEAEPTPPVVEAPVVEAAPASDHEPLVSESASVTTASAFDRLSTAAHGAAAAARPTMAMPPPGLTLEDVTRELLRPMLKAWLDEHLPAIVQDRVDEEVARISRGRVR